ncbi:unnamed protein product, partial [marine sediment metagenome]
ESIERQTMNVEDVAVALGISRGLAYALVKQGDIPCLRFGKRRVVIPKPAFERWFHQLSETALNDIKQHSEAER